MSSIVPVTMADNQLQHLVVFNTWLCLWMCNLSRAWHWWLDSCYTWCQLGAAWSLPTAVTRKLAHSGICQVCGTWAERTPTAGGQNTWGSQHLSLALCTFLTGSFQHDDFKGARFLYRVVGSSGLPSYVSQEKARQKMFCLLVTWPWKSGSITSARVSGLLRFQGRRYKPRTSWCHVVRRGCRKLCICVWPSLENNVLAQAHRTKQGI